MNSTTPIPLRDTSSEVIDNARRWNMFTAHVTLADLAQMPKQTQLLVAHCLEQDNPSLTVLDGDVDVCSLVSAGWLTSVPCSTIGVSSFRVKPQFWRELRSLRSKFLTNQLLSDLKTYRQRKSTLYPWVW